MNAAKQEIIWCKSEWNDLIAPFWDALYKHVLNWFWKLQGLILKRFFVKFFFQIFQDTKFVQICWWFICSLTRVFKSLAHIRTRDSKGACVWFDRLQCFKSSWLLSVLHDGLGFPHRYHHFTSLQYVGGQEVHWTLGAILYKTKYFPLRWGKHFVVDKVCELKIYWAQWKNVEAIGVLKKNRLRWYNLKRKKNGDWVKRCMYTATPL